MNMNEKMPQNNMESTEEQEKRGEEELAYYLQNHPELIEKIERVPYEEKYAEEMEKLFFNFESEFPLDQLIAITTKEEALESELRNRAKEALIPIHSYIKKIMKETEVPNEVEQKIEDRREKISMAVGFINSGRVRHE